MAFTEFTIRSGGSNMNGGRLNSNGEAATSPVYSATNGAWNSATGVFTPTSGDPSLTVTVGDFAHVFTDGSTTPTFIGRVTARTTTTITVSTTARSGTAPTTAASGVSINVGGAWAGPSGTTIFPFNFALTTMTDSSNNCARINFKNDQTYSVTASLNHNALQGPMKWQGYTSSFGDGGRAIIDGGTSGASYILLNVNNVRQHWFEDFIFQNNGATGSASLVATTTGGNAIGWFRRCVFAHSRGHGLELAQGAGSAIECEAYDCNQSNTSNLAGFALSAGAARVIRCISHDHGTPGNAGDNNRHGYVMGTQTSLMFDSIADSCGGSGIRLISNGGTSLVKNCDSYNNGGDGFTSSIGGGVTNLYIENSNFIKNAGYGISLVDASTMAAMLVKNGFGSGSMANASGQTNITTGTDMVEVIDSVTYASGAAPWVDPDNGDFRIVLATAKGTGRSEFTQTASSYAGTVGYQDIGAAQHKGFFARVLRLFEGYTIKFYNGKIILHQK